MRTCYLFVHSVKIVAGGLTSNSGYFAEFQGGVSEWDSRCGVLDRVMD